MRKPKIRRRSTRRLPQRLKTHALQVESLEKRNLLAGDTIDFEPLSQSVQIGSRYESAPLFTSANLVQQIAQSRFADPELLPGAGAVTANATNVRGHTDIGRYLFTAHELTANAAITRTDIWTSETVVIAEQPHWEQLGEITWTPWGTLLVGEKVTMTSLPDPTVQTDGSLVSTDHQAEAFANRYSGLVYEVDPFPEDNEAIPPTARPALGAMQHGGIAIADGIVYLADSYEQGSIYRFTPAVAGDLAAGLLEVIQDRGGGDGGPASWVAVKATPDLDPQVNARALAQALNATTFDTPGDVAMRDGALYVALTWEHRIIKAIDAASDQPEVVDYVTQRTLDAASNNFASQQVRGPGAMIFDHQGRLVFTEVVADLDSQLGPDVWIAGDVNGDGTADRIARMASLSTEGATLRGLARGTGTSLYLSVQAPTSENDSIVKLSAPPKLDFEPLPYSAVLETGSTARETVDPFDVATGFSQYVIQYGTNPNAPENDLRAYTELFNRTLDMITVNETGPDAGRYLFTTHEVRRPVETSAPSSAASITRLDLQTGEQVTISHRDDYERFDGIRWTPWGTLLTGEETRMQAVHNRDPDFPDAEAGLFYEILNPLADPGAEDPALRPRTVVRPAVGAMAHEGIVVDANGYVYVINEASRGSIFRFVPDQPNTPSALESGTLYALVALNEGQDFNAGYEPNAERLGVSQWVPLVGEETVIATLPADFNNDGIVDAADLDIVTANLGKQGATRSIGDANGDRVVDSRDLDLYHAFEGQAREQTVQLEQYVTINAQAAANAVGAATYLRPEDLELSTHENGDQFLLVAITGGVTSGVRQLHGTRVLSVVINDSDETIIRNYMTPDTLNAANGRRVGAEFQSADNLAIDQHGTIYVVEDQPAGDVWAVVDQDGNGQGEVAGRWASLSTFGAEPTGLYFNPLVPGEAFINVQHPPSNREATVRIIRSDTGLPGDINQDRIVDVADLNIMGVNWLQQDRGRLDGDLSGDGIVDAVDLNQLGVHWLFGRRIRADRAVRSPRAPLAVKLVHDEICHVCQIQDITLGGKQAVDTFFAKVGSDWTFERPDGVNSDASRLNHRTSMQFRRQRRG